MKQRARESIPLRRSPLLAALVATALLGTLLHPSTAHADRRPPTALKANRLDELLRLQEHVVPLVDKAALGVVFLRGGSGVCVSEDGLILTNDHVVGDAKEFSVRFGITGALFRAKLLGRFPNGDLAVLRLEGKKGTRYPFLSLGDSDTLTPGEHVVALGNPFLLAVNNEFFPTFVDPTQPDQQNVAPTPPDFHPSVTLGVISAIHRNSPPKYSDAIQVDVAVNPGNSGGPLINLDGEVVGLNGKIETRFHVSVNSGVGYAVPSRSITRFLEPLKNAGGKAIPYGKLLGVDVEERVITGSGGLPVKLVATNSPAGLAGLQPGDRIVSIDNYPIATKKRFAGLLQTYPVDSRVKIHFQRGSDALDVDVPLIHLDPKLPKAPLGVSFDAVEEAKGRLKISSVKEGSLADTVGILVGDLLVRFDRLPVSLFAQVEDRMKEKGPGDVVIIRVRRSKKLVDIPILLQAAP